MKPRSQAWNASERPCRPSIRPRIITSTAARFHSWLMDCKPVGSVESAENRRTREKAVLCPPRLAEWISIAAADELKVWSLRGIQQQHSSLSARNENEAANCLSLQSRQPPETHKNCRRITHALDHVYQVQNPSRLILFHIQNRFYNRQSSNWNIFLTGNLTVRILNKRIDFNYSKLQQTNIVCTTNKIKVTLKWLRIRDSGVTSLVFGIKLSKSYISYYSFFFYDH